MASLGLFVSAFLIPLIAHSAYPVRNLEWFVLDEMEKLKTLDQYKFYPDSKLEKTVQPLATDAHAKYEKRRERALDTSGTSAAFMFWTSLIFLSVLFVSRWFVADRREDEKTAPQAQPHGIPVPEQRPPLLLHRNTHHDYSHRTHPFISVSGGHNPNWNAYDFSGGKFSSVPAHLGDAWHRTSSHRYHD